MATEQSGNRKLADACGVQTDAPTRSKLPFVICAIVGMMVAIYVAARLMATTSGFPNLTSFSSADVYIYDENDFGGRIEPLTSKEEEDLRRVLSTLRPIGLGVDANSLPSVTGWPGEMFLLTLDDGRTVTVKDAYQHVLVGYVDPGGRTRAWRASDSFLTALHGLYQEVLANHLDAV